LLIGLGIERIFIDSLSRFVTFPTRFGQFKALVAHTEEDIERTIEANKKALEAL
jgi:glutamate-1-semialdehyde aminotransferase